MCATCLSFNFSLLWQRRASLYHNNTIIVLVKSLLKWDLLGTSAEQCVSSCTLILSGLISISYIPITELSKADTDISQGCAKNKAEPTLQNRDIFSISILSFYRRHRLWANFLLRSSKNPCLHSGDATCLRKDGDTMSTPQTMVSLKT